MVSSPRERGAVVRDTEWYLAFGLTTLVVSIDVWLIFFGRYDSWIQLRLGLAALAFGVVVVCFIGALRETVRPAAVLLGFPLAVIYSYTGLILPWGQFSYWAGQLTVEEFLSVPFVGEPLARLVFGGYSLSQASLRNMTLLHRAVLALVILTLLYGVGRKLWSWRTTNRRNADEGY